jgi:hypothetical protein
MTTKELWIGRVEVLTPPTDLGDTKAFTNVETWANSSQEFREKVDYVFEEYGWSLLGVEDCGAVSLRKDFGEDVSDAIERARNNPEACIYSTFYYYPSKPS